MKLALNETLGFAQLTKDLGNHRFYSDATFLICPTPIPPRHTGLKTPSEQFRQDGAAHGIRLADPNQPGFQSPSVRTKVRVSHGAHVHHPTCLGALFCHFHS